MQSSHHWRVSTSLRRACSVVAIFAGISFAGAAFAATPAPGDTFPKLSEFGLAGDLPDTSEARVVIVDFWASWCAPCKASFPMFDELTRDFGPKGLVVVGVSVDQNAKAYEAFLKRMKPGFPVVHDVGQKLVAQVAVPTMPTSFVLDRTGTVRFVHQGFHGDKSRSEYLEQIRTILSEQQ